MILCGDARNLPLADESGYTCVTSPPYWGLRQYEGVEPSVWGGGECEHVWGETQRVYSTPHTGLRQAAEDADDDALNLAIVEPRSKHCELFEVQSLRPSMR